MKKLIAVFGIVLASTTASAASMSGDLEMRVMPTNGGAWVRVTQGGMPVEGAVINFTEQLGDYVTPASGRVFVLASHQSARSITFKATDLDGNMVTKRRLVPRDRD